MSKGYPVVLKSDSGVLKNFILQPTVTGSANFANNKECISDANGFKSFTFLISGFTTASAEALVIGFSTTENDKVLVKASIDEAITKYTTPTGVGNTNVIVIPLNSLSQALLTIDYDGTNPIKTLGVEITGAVAGIKVVAQASGA